MSEKPISPLRQRMIDVRQTFLCLNADRHRTTQIFDLVNCLSHCRTRQSLSARTGMHNDPLD
jgi:hypothetical protein